MINDEWLLTGRFSRETLAICSGKAPHPLFTPALPKQVYPPVFSHLPLHSRTS
jgi:hypothetical protein